MACPSSQLAPPAEPSASRERIRTHAQAVLTERGEPLPMRSEGDRDAALATSLMDCFRRTGDAEVFDCLVRWVGPQLHARIRSRLRGLGGMFDAHEILQDTLVNIYRYPDRFLASRAGAFAAWSSTIVDNAIRRQLRKKRQGVELSLRAPELLQEHADRGMRDPSLAAQDHEECAATTNAFTLLLQCYLHAFQSLSERERFVLQMVEVRQTRYAELATVLGIRAEAIKMVVFRARKRIFDRIGELLGGAVPLVAGSVTELKPRLAIA